MKINNLCKLISPIVLITNIYSSNNNIIVDNTNEQLKMVITNKNIALVNETRNFIVKNDGMNTIVYKEVPSSLMSDTVIPKFKGIQHLDKTTLYTQKYNYNTINFNNIIKEYLGKTIRYKENNISRTGKLISLNPMLVKDNINNQIKFVKDRDFEIKDIPVHLTIKPNLSWDIHTNQGDKKLNLLYLTSGINWEANYALKYNQEKKTIDLSSFITIKNKSGKAFKNVDIKLLSGNINIVQPRQHINRMYKKRMVMESVMGNAPSNGVSQKEFAGYHIYKIPFKVDINDNENSMINFLDEKNIKTNKIYSSTLPNLQYITGSRNFKFSQSLKFKINKPLPTGKITMYQEDKNEAIFIGSTRVKNTPKNEYIKLKYGENFDLLGKIKITDKYTSSHYFKTTFEIEIKNKSNKDKNIEFIFSTANNVNKTTLTSSCYDMKKCSVEKQNVNTYKYKLLVKANSKQILTNKIEYYK